MWIVKIYLVIFLITVSSLLAFADGMKDIQVNETANGQSLLQYLAEIESIYDVDFIYSHEELEANTIFGVAKKYKIEDF